MGTKLESLPLDTQRYILERLRESTPVTQGKSMIINIPMKLPSLANTRMHWRAMNRLKTAQKQIIRCCLPIDAVVVLPATVTLTRIGKRTLDDDNLASAFKVVRDEIAHYMGVDDGSPLYTWRYEQRKGEYGIEIKIES